MTRTGARRAVAGVMFTLVAAGLLAVFVTATYGLSSEYGFVLGNVQPLDGLIVLVLGGIALLLLLGARAQFGSRRPTAAVLAVSVLVVFAGSAAASAVLGGGAHDRRTATMATACSAQDHALLAGVDFPGFRLGPLGDTKGGCLIQLFPQTDPPTAVDDVTAALERDGWRRTERDDTPPTLERDGAVMTVTAASDGKVTELVLTLR